MIRRQPKPLTRRWHLVNGLLGLSMFSLCMCGTTAYNGLEMIRLDRDGLTAQATVVAVAQRPKEDITTIRFTAADREITTACRECPTDVAVGETFTVRYDPSAPATTVERAGSNSYRGLALFTGALFLIASAGAAVLAVLLLRDRRRTAPTTP